MQVLCVGDWLKMVKHKAMDDWAVTFVAPQATQASINATVHQQTANCKTLRNLRNKKNFLQILAKLRIAKPCETRICETLALLIL